MRDCSVLCVPVVLPSADTVGVLEFTRDHLKAPFSQSDVQLIQAAVSWMAACIHENGLKRILDTQHELNEFLLEITKGLFKEITCVDKVVKTILHFTKHLLHADRCSMYLVEEEQAKTFVAYEDTGTVDDDGKEVYDKKKVHDLHSEDEVAWEAIENGKVGSTMEGVILYNHVTVCILRMANCFLSRILTIRSSVIHGRLHFNIIFKSSTEFGFLI